MKAEELAALWSAHNADHAAFREALRAQGAQFLSQSRVNTFLRCPGCYFREYVLEVRTESEATRIGTLFHDAVQRAYRSKRAGGENWGHGATVAAHPEHNATLSPAGRQQLANALVTFSRHRWPDEHIIAIEQVMFIDISPALPAVMGIPDLVISRPDGGAIVVDHKTTKKFQDRAPDQLVLYAEMVRRAHGYRDVSAAFDEYRLVPQLETARNPVFRRTPVEVPPEQFAALAQRWEAAWPEIQALHAATASPPIVDCPFCWQAGVTTRSVQKPAPLPAALRQSPINEDELSVMTLQYPAVQTARLFSRGFRTLGDIRRAIAAARGTSSDDRTMLRPERDKMRRRLTRYEALHAKDARPRIYVTRHHAHTTIASLGLSNRASKALHAYGCSSVVDLNGLSTEELLKLRDIGPKSGTEILDALSVLCASATPSRPDTAAATNNSTQLRKEDPPGQPPHTKQRSSLVIGEVVPRHHQYADPRHNAQISGDMPLHEPMAQWSILVLHQSAKVSRNFFKHGACTLGDVHELGDQQLMQTGEVSQEEMETIRARLVEASLMFDSSVQRISLPAEAHAVPIGSAGFSTRVRNALHKYGCTVLGHLVGVSRQDIGQLIGLGYGSAEDVFARLYGEDGLLQYLTSATTLPFVHRYSQDGASESRAQPLDGDDTPRRDPGTATASHPMPKDRGFGLASLMETCFSPNDELRAFIESIGARHQESVRGRLVKRGGRHTTLDELAAARGVTRERIRQVVDRARGSLQSAGIRFRHLSEALSSLQQARSMWGIPDALEFLSTAGYAISESTLRSAPMLAEWDVVPAVDIDRNDLLVFPSPDDKGIPADLLESVRSSVHRLRFFGWCRPEEWPSDPVVDSIVQSRAKARGWSLVRESGIVMVDPPPETANMRWVEKVLAAYGPMPIRSLYARMSTHAAGPFGERFRLDYPEYKGFLALLRRDHRFAVANGAVTARDHSRANEHLTDTERAVLNVLATRGASVSWADIIEETSHLGLAVATVSLVLQSPLVDRTARGMYALASGGT